MGYILHRQYETSQNSCHHFSLSICLLYGLCANNLSLFIYTNIIPQIYWDSFVCVPQNYNAKISDFGLAKFGPTGEDSHVSTRVMGTFVYAAPEYMATGDYIYTKCLWKYLNLFDQKKKNTWTCYNWTWETILILSDIPMWVVSCCSIRSFVCQEWCLWIWCSVAWNADRVASTWYKEACGETESGYMD